MPDSVSLFFELFDHLPRQGPGDHASTRRALAMVGALPATARIVDLGCGTGMQTMALAGATHAPIIAIDAHAPYIGALRQRAAALGFTARIDARVGDMGALDTALAPIDLIWCEGAIYNLGVETALRSWRPLLAPGGHVAFTEACWMRPDPPADCVAFWEAEYPAIRPVETIIERIAGCGFDVVGHFAVPPSAWWDEYYAPLERRLAPFREAHAGDPVAEGLASQVEREIAAWRRFADPGAADVAAGGPFYGYEFFVVRNT